MAVPAELEVVFKAKDQMAGAIRQVNSHLDSVQQHHNKLKGALLEGGKIAGMALLGVGAAAAAASVAAVKMAADFDEPMRKIYSLTGISEQQFEDYKKQVLDLSDKVPKSATDLANGLYYVISAGYQGADAMKILEMSSKAAAAGLTDTQTVADAVTSAMNAYKLKGTDAAHVTDLLTNAVLQGKTEYGDLAASIGKILPVAASAGVGLDQVLASLATMTRVGLNADDASTYLRATLSGLTKITPAAAKGLKEIGLSADQVRKEIRDKGLLTTLQDMMDRTHGNITVLEKIFPNIRALTGVLATAGSQGEAYQQILGSMQHANGLTEESFKRTAAGVNAQTQLLKNHIERIGITLGDALLPTVLKIVEAIDNGLGPAIDFVRGLFAGLTGSAQRTGGAFSAFLAPVRTFVNDLRVFFAPAIEKAVAALSKFWIEVQPKLTAAINAIRHVIEIVVAGIQAFWQAHWMEIVTVLVDVWRVIQDTVKIAFDIIGGIIKIALDLLSGNWQGAWTDLGTMVHDVFNDLWTWLKDFFGELVPHVLNLAAEVGKAIVAGVLEGIGSLKTALGNFLGTGISLLGGGAAGARSITSAQSSIQAANLPAFQGGGIMPHTGLAFLHAGERITPAGSSSSTIFAPQFTINYSGPATREAAHEFSRSVIDDITLGLQDQWRRLAPGVATP